MKSAFSLMEMMVVLLIVAIVAAATAPMVTKKMIRSAGSTDSPWLFTGIDGSIVYNMQGTKASAIIGAIGYVAEKTEPKYPRLVVANGEDVDSPALVFADKDGKYSGQIIMDKSTGVVALNNSPVGSNSVAIGMGQTTFTDTSSGIVAVGQEVTADGADAIAIGHQAKATKERTLAIGNNSRAYLNESIAIGYLANTVDKASNSIAIGKNATVTDSYSIALGCDARASHSNSIAIGQGAIANRPNSIAIGQGVTTNKENQIVLGSPTDTVVIPGHLVVGDVFVNNMSKSQSPEGLMFRAISSWSEAGVSSDIQKFVTTWNTVTGNGYRAAKVLPVNVPSWANGALSDRRLKNVGEKYTAGLDELKKLDFYNYTFKKDENKTPLVGVMAQDLQKVFPNAVIKGDDGYLRIRLEDMFYAVINAVKELDNKISSIIADVTDVRATIKSQQETIDKLQKENSELKEEISNIEKRIKKLERSKFLGNNKFAE